MAEKNQIFSLFVNLSSENPEKLQLQFLDRCMSLISFDPDSWIDELKGFKSIGFSAVGTAQQLKEYSKKTKRPTVGALGEMDAEEIPGEEIPGNPGGKSRDRHFVRLILHAYQRFATDNFLSNNQNYTFKWVFV